MVLNNLKQIRESKGFSKEDLASKCMLTVRTIENMEKLRGCTLNNAKRVAAFLKVPVEKLTVKEA